MAIIPKPFSILLLHQKLSGKSSKQPNQFLIPDVIQAHLENFFPSLVIFHGKSLFGKIVQCHIFVPESLTKTRTYVLCFGETGNPLAKLFKKQFLEIVEVVVEQDAGILNKIYADAPQKIRLNNEIGMDWVKKNFNNWEKESVMLVLKDTASHIIIISNYLLAMLF